MAIAYKDFAPRMVASRTLLRAEEFQNLDDALSEANAWLEEQGVDVIHVETVVLPNIWRSVEEGTADASLSATGNISTWHQFIRVWYRS